MDAPLPWERLLWSRRGLLRPRARYVLTDFRLVCLDGRQTTEIAIQDIARVRRDRDKLDRLLRTWTVIVFPHARKPAIVLRHLRHGDELAARLELLAGLPQAPLASGSVRAALSWEPPTTARGTRKRVAIAAAVLATLIIAMTGHRETAASIAYSPDDAIYPGGVKRDHEEIVQFMRTRVLPWARSVLAPIKGGSENVTCETCHGLDAESRDWHMPSVSRLPEPHVRMLGWELYSPTMDPQLRNAVYGYSADSDNQAKAAYMRKIVMPGMARLLNRPAYDFTRTYEYNRSRMAFGCYHCHRVR